MDNRVSAKTNENNETNALSRRGFFGLMGAGIATVLWAQVGDGTITYAYADEAGQIQWEVRVVARWEAGIVVHDPTKSDPDKQSIVPIPDAKITFFSYATNKSFEGITDKEGAVIIDLHDFAEANSLGWDQYACWGSLKIEKEGYRTFETGMVRVNGADVVSVPAQAQDGKAYFSKVTFDNFDIQYSTDMDFCLSSKNREKHSVGIKFLTSSASPVTLGYWHKGKLWQEQQITPQNGVAEVTLSHADLLYDSWVNSWGFTENQPVEVRAKQDGVTTKLQTKFKPIEGVLSAASGGVNKHFPFHSHGTGVNPFSLSVTIPKGVPLIGGSKINLWTPELPITYAFDPTGYLAIGLGINSTLYMQTDGRPDPDGCKRQPLKSAKDQWKAQKELWQKAKNNYKDAHTYAGPFTGTGLMDVYSKMRFGWSAGAGFYAEWERRNEEWVGGSEMSIGLRLSYLFSLQYSLGPIPAYVNFDFSAELASRIAGEMAVKGFFDSYKFKPAGGEVWLTIALAVGAGIGIDGLASIGVRGGGYVTTLVGYFPESRKPQPHFLVQVGASLSWVVQIFIAKWSGTIIESKWPAIYDNWADRLENPEIFEAAQTAEEFMFDLGGGQVGFSCAPADLPGSVTTDPNAGFVLVKNSELAETKELVATARPEGQSEEEEELEILDTAQLPDETEEALDAADASQPLSETEESEEAETLDETKKLEEAENEADLDVSPSEAEEEVVPSATLEAVAEYDYTYFADDGGSTTFADCGTAGLVSLGVNGIKPITDEIIYKDVFSAPQVKVVTDTDGVSYLFRILTVEYPGNLLRSRLAVSLYDKNQKTWQQPRALEFPFQGDTTDKRIESFDYDFDVTVNRALGSYAPLSVHIVSGTRPAGDNTDLIGLFSAEWYSSQLQIRSDGTVRYASTKKINIPGNQINTVPLYPFVEWLEQGQIFYGYLLSEIPSGSTPFNGSSKAIIDFTSRADDHKKRAEWTKPVNANFLGKTVSQWERPTMFRTYVARDNHMELMIPSASLGAVEVYYTKEGQAGNSNPIYSRSGSAFRRVYIGGQEGFLYVKRENNVLWFESLLDPVGFAVGPADFQMGAFTTSEDGKWLYMTKLETGPTADKVDENNNHAQQPNQKKYQIYVAMLSGNRYANPFVFCELDAPVDEMVFVNLGNAHEATAILYHSISDMKRSATNIHCAVVPFVAFIELTGFYSRMPLVGAGKEEPFFVECRNDGNTLVRSCILELMDDKGTVFQELTLSFGRANIVPDQQDILEATALSEETFGVNTAYELTDDAILDEASEAGVLVPGRRRLFKINVTIPQEWRGKRVIQARVKKGSIDIVTLPATVSFGENEPPIFGMEETDAAAAIDGTELFDLAVLPAEVSAVQLEFEDEVEPSYYTYETDGTDDDDDDDDDDDNGGGGGKGTPKAGDASNIAIPAAVALAGAGLAAYSLRRSRLEANSDSDTEQ